MHLTSQNNCILTKFQISYRFPEDIEVGFLNTSIRINMSNPTYK